MSITKITTPELLDFPKDSTSSANTSGTIIPTGYTNACNFPTFSSGVALYEFENNANDTCGNYNLTEVGSPSYVTGKFGEAIQFNGTSQGATSSSAVIPNGAATISLWFNGNGTATMEFYIIGVGVAGSAYGLDIHYYDDGIIGGRFYGGVVDGGGFQGVGTGSTTVNTSTWYHLALTWDGSTNADSMKLYLNGALETNITPTVTAASLTYSSFGICHFSGTSTYAPGIVDQVRIFNSVLTPTQITELYNETTTEVYRPTTPSLNAGEFRFNTTAGYVEYYDGSTWQQIADEYITGQPSACICNYPSNTTPIALYELNDLTDTCGSWSNATNVGSATFTSGKFGNALTLNGSSQWLELLDTWTYSNNFSCSVWVYIHDFTPSSSYPMVLGFWGSGSYAWFIELNAASTPEFNAYMYGPALRVGSTSTLTLNTWYHIVFTTSSTEGKKFYLNGVLEEHNADTQDATTTTAGGNWIGQSTSTWINDAFDGQIDQLRFYNSVLTQTQITELYNEIPCN